MKRNASIFYTVRKTNTIYYHLSPHASTEKKAGMPKMGVNLIVYLDKTYPNLIPNY